MKRTESGIEDKRDALVHEAEEAVHGVEVSMLTDPRLKAEMPPFFSKQCLRTLSACAAGYFATALYGYDAGTMVTDLQTDVQVSCPVSTS
jgi:hypothetical protein